MNMVALARRESIVQRRVKCGYVDKGRVPELWSSEVSRGATKVRSDRKPATSVVQSESEVKDGATAVTLRMCSARFGSRPLMVRLVSDVSGQVKQVSQSATGGSTSRLRRL